MAIETRRMTYSVDEAAAILGVSKTKIYDSVRNGELRGVQVGRRVVIPCDVLEQLLGSLLVGQHGEARDRVPATADGEPETAGRKDLNAVYLTGTIARRAELRTSRTGLAVCTLRLAVSRCRRDGQPCRPLHIDVVAFETTAETAAAHDAGVQVTVIGRLGYRMWTSSAGTRHTHYEIVADSIRPTDRPEPAAP